MKKTIIAVDDDPITLNLIKQKLASAFDVNCCDCAESAKLVLARKTPNLLVMDIHLGESNGIRVVEQLKADGVSFPIPVLFISSDAKQSNVEQIQAIPNAHFLNKVKINLLSDRVGELLNVPSMRSRPMSQDDNTRDRHMADAKLASAQIKSSIEKLLAQLEGYSR